MSDPKTIQDALTTFVPGHRTVLELRNADDGDTDISFRLVKEPRPRASSPPRQHAFQNVDGFVAYLNKYGTTKDTLVLCDITSGQCRAVLKESADEGFEIVTFTPQLHPTFAAWDHMLDGTYSILDLATFIQKQRRAIDGGVALAKLMRQIKASISIEAQEGIGNGKTNGLTTTVKIAGVLDKLPIELPETITIKTPLFIDSEHPATLELDLVIDASSDGKKVTATLTAPTLDTVRFEELKEYAAKFGAFTFAFGAPGHGAWRYID